MMRIFGTIFAGLMGLCFGSFLNVCLSRWPEGESVVRPGSHCRQCGRTLAWWENIPLLSWLALRGRCRTCRAWIGWRYPLVELSVGALWAFASWQAMNSTDIMDAPSDKMPMVLIAAIFQLVFYWLLVALALLDAEHLWLPNWLTWPGIALGYFIFNATVDLDESALKIGMGPIYTATYRLIGILVAACIILLIRWSYWLIRRREGVGLGDAKLMALLAAWLGLPQALLAFVVGVMLGALAAMIVLVLPKARRESESWAASKLPLGTFLCIGGIVISLWGQPILAAYLRRAGM
jgi:leader peptidase (prepilin peptidase)/N-methyltransferase